MATRPRLLIVGALAGLLLGVPVAPSVAATGRCFGPSKPGFKRYEVSRTRSVRLYWRSEVGFPRDDGAVYACWRRTGQVFALGGNGVSSGIGSFMIRGRFVAFTSEEYNRGSSDTSVAATVVDVQARRIRHDWRYTQYSGLTDRTVPLMLRARHLRANGSFAVLVGPYSDPLDHSPVYEVRAADRRGDRVLDRSTDIVGSSFSVQAHSLSWRHGPETRTAAFD